MAACAPVVAPGEVVPDAGADLSSCGAGMGFILAASNLVAPMIDGIAGANNEQVGRNGHLRDTLAAARLESVLEPLDIVLVARQHRIGARFIPGFLTHAALWVGSPAQLQAAGGWSDPVVAAHRAEIAAGARLIEASAGPVSLVTLDEVLDADAVVVLRQQGLARRGVQEGLHTALAYHGTPFDSRFDADDPERVYCTELVARALPDAGLPRDRIAGRAMILPDRVATAMLDGEAPLDLVTFLYADARGLHEGDAARLRASIAANWPAPGG